MQCRTALLDLPILCMLMILNLVDKSFQNRNHDRWEHISVRYGFWHKLPPYQPNAEENKEYVRLNDVCKTDYYHGFLFEKPGNTKAMPIYDSNGNLAGIQAAIPGNMRGFNFLNETIALPPAEIMPPLLKGLRDKKGILYYTVTAYFKHPKLICSPIASKDVTPGRGLYIQMGFNPENDYLYIPKEQKHLSSLWRKGTCRPQMGTHYFMNLSQHLPCEKLYPVFLMYNSEGKLGAFGWVFQGRPMNFYSNDNMGWFYLTPVTYPFMYDTNMLPACMKNDKFQVFGIHVYLQDHTKLLCTSSSHTHNTTRSHNITHSRGQEPATYITADTNEGNKNSKSENNAIDAFNRNRGQTLSCKTCVLLPILILTFTILFLKRNFH